ncbi:hypothetical protein X798_02928 [Onchocerca flexuosa]|uniref:RRM domain-containing protein n=1 Tax=Onchocerca flexuosa TaxID=387005 RepID=A0A238BXV8_9BILA|nr:hypothetical protein X798_02928 [Onchocerca flexuosa]
MINNRLRSQCGVRQIVGFIEYHHHEIGTLRYIGKFGRVQKVERLGATDFVVSFMDVRSAQKAHSTEPKFQGHQLRIAFHEQSKK